MVFCCKMWSHVLLESNVFSHWLRPCSAIDRKWTQLLPCLLHYFVESSASFVGDPSHGFVTRPWHDCNLWGPVAFLNLMPVEVITLRQRQNGRHFTDDVFKCIFLNENLLISIKISLNFVPKGPINNIPALVQIMAWCRAGGKPLSGPMMINILMHICISWPQWVSAVSSISIWSFNTFHIFFFMNPVCILYEALINELYIKKSLWNLYLVHLYFLSISYKISKHFIWSLNGFHK